MKPALLFTGITLLALVTTACRSRYELTLSNTNVIDAYSRPKLDNGYYVFKDAKGEEVKILPAR